MPSRDPSEKTRYEIIETAAKLFSEKGWQDVKIEDIVNEVGVTRGAFYHYFKSRQELVVAVADKIFFDNNPFVLVSKRNDLNAIEKLRLTFKISLESNFSNANRGRAKELHKALDNPVTFKSEFESQLHTVAPYIEKLILEGNKDGSISVKYPKQTSEILAILPSMWIGPTMFNVGFQEVIDKVLFFKHMTDSIGIPIASDEVIEQVLKHKEFI